MPASHKLAQAGLHKIKPFGADEAALVSTDAFTVGQAAPPSDAQRMLNWSDLMGAMDLWATNSSVTPIVQPVQALRPFPWLQADVDMIKGSYLFDIDQVSDTGVPLRIIQVSGYVCARAASATARPGRRGTCCRRELLIQQILEILATTTRR